MGGARPVFPARGGGRGPPPHGEVALARAAASRGTSTALSCFASRSVEDVCRAGAPTLVQLHWIGGRDRLAATLERVRAAGAAGIILTTDWSFSEGRDWGSPRIPEQVDLGTALRFAPECLARPRWLARYARSGAPPTLGTPNLLRADGSEHGFFSAYREWLDTPPPSWDDVAWLRERWGGTFLLKGVVRVDDAHRAVDAGVTAVSVSNHGGNNLDGTPAAVRALPAVAAAVGHEVEVLTDGGVRRGADVAAALALGARAVLLGRAPLWGLAADGQAGAETVLDVVREGLEDAVRAAGRSSVHELSPADVVVPAGFGRVLGGPRR